MSNVVTSAAKIVILPWVIIGSVVVGTVVWYARGAIEPAETTGSAARTSTLECPGIPVSFMLTEKWTNINPGARCALYVNWYTGVIEIGTKERTTEINSQTPSGPSVLAGVSPQYARAKYGTAQMVVIFCDWRSRGLSKWTNTCQSF